ncbi:MAG: patatin-like phospholipase family protein [Rhizobacter sp.]|nr:patatin-like phospholipase family protein [Rhizobacter sp.]
MLIAVAALVIAACATPRPNPGITCTLTAGAQTPQPAPAMAPGDRRKARALRAWALADSPQPSALRRQIAQNYLDRMAEKAAPRPLPAPPGPGALPPVPAATSYDILVLSAGGQYGAYGSGFLKGWGDRADLIPGRAAIDMITGVSTGALMATYAYLGSSNDAAVRARFDDILKEQYTTLNDEDIFRQRGTLELLWANSVRDTAPLKTRLMRLITDELLDEVVAEAQRSKRLLFIGAVNADSGHFEHFDLIAMAGDTSESRRACYVSAILAAAAIPVAFNPVFINGQMYLDGGVRQHAFFLEQVAAALPQPTKNILGILHGDLQVGVAQTKNGLIGVASRATTLMTDQLMLDSAYYVDAEGKRLGFDVQWTAAASVDCPTDDDNDSFSPIEGRCLWDAGLARARDEADPWKELRELTGP